jgi:outer membrane immunogenic protein
LARQQHLWKRQ